MTKDRSGEKLFLIDAMSLVFRAFYAPMQMSLVSPTGTPTKAVYIFLRTLRKLLKDHAPDRVAVAFDLAAPTFRDKLFEDYKANRPEFPEDLGVQLPYVRRFCRALGLPLVEKEGYEADDIIGTLARQGSAEGMDVFIVSGDEDLFQLVNEKVRVLKPSSRSSEGETLCGAEKVKEIIGVAPEQVVDWLALTGDPSDNIPGARPLPGQEPPLAEGQKKRSHIGPKGATELIQRFGTLEKVLENYETVERQSYRDALRDYKKEALLSRELATIRTDVPLDVTAEQAMPAEANLDEIRALCQELGFTSLLAELLEASGKSEAAIESHELTSAKAIRDWLKSLAVGAPVALGFAAEGEEGFGANLTSVGLSDGKRIASLTASRDILKPLDSVLADARRPKTVHNAKFLQLLLQKSGSSLAGVADDTMLYSYLLDPLASGHSLEDVVLRRLARRISGSPGEAAERTRELAALFIPEVAREELKKLYDEIELPLASVLVAVEAAGIKIDPKILAAMSGEFSKELTELTRQIYDLAGESFDIDSPKQLGEILFGKLKLAGGKRLKKSGQYSTTAAVLESLAEAHELPRKIIEYRTRAKLMSTYIEALPRYVNSATGRVHTCFNQMVARTGRLSSSNPNLQNIPIGDEFGLSIRSAFVAEKGWKLISADYSQIELRVLAHMSGDPRLIEAFSHDEDIHARTASEIFGVMPGLQTHEHRRMAKAINYGVIYGLSSFGLAGRTGTSKTEAQQYIDAYFARYSKVKEFLDHTVDQARKSGRVRTLFGRLRPIPEIHSNDIPARNRAEREAMNTPLQGTAADLMKLAMVKSHARLEREKMQTRMILTVHDELVFEAPDAEVEKAREIVRAEMEGAFAMKVPLKVDLGVGENWKEAK
ncbi:MAG: DNA polymerase I [Deltaproteobacteria bacterium]